MKLNEMQQSAVIGALMRIQEKIWENSGQPLINVQHLVNAGLESAGLLTKSAPDLLDSAPLPSLSTPEADTPAGHLSTPPTSG